MFANIVQGRSRPNHRLFMSTTGSLPARAEKTMTTIWLHAVDTRAITTTVV
jgi:hypothetical protein